MKTTLPGSLLRDVTSRLKADQDVFFSRYPGELATRQPVHTVYGGAHLFRHDTTRKLGAVALQALADHAPDEACFAEAILLEPALAQVIYARVKEKLFREPVEDFRIDFEDGYGNRPDAEEDGHAEAAAREVAKGMSAGTLTPFLGIRIKALSGELCARSLRTMDVFLTTLLETSSALPEHFVVTLPKVTSPEQVTVLADLFDALEPALGLRAGALRMELMIETTQSILDPGGQSMLPKLVPAARGRCVAAHFGTYDYTASCQITASLQRMQHPACDFAKHMIKVAYAGTGLWLSDGATNIMPVAPHRPAPGGPALSVEQARENRRVVWGAWRLHVADVRHSLANGFYQGWDLHPAQLPTRYAAIYAFFLEGLAAASTRLANFIAKAAQATLVGDVFDDAATGQGLLNFFLRGVNCGALTEKEAQETGLTLDELRCRSFSKILANRRKGG